MFFTTFHLSLHSLVFLLLDISDNIMYLCKKYAKLKNVMTSRRLVFLPLLMIDFLLLSVFCGCGEDRWKEYYPFTGKSLWIDSVMRENYLWYEDIPSFDELNYFMDPKEFLDEMRSPRDKGFSSIDTIYDTPPICYGFDYTLYRMGENDTAYTALITYVTPQSPAADAGIKRGEWIMMVDDSIYLTQKTETILSQSMDSHKLTIGKYEIMHTEDGEEIGVISSDRIVQLPEARPVNDITIPAYTILTTQNGNVGYLVYNSFDRQADAELCRLSQEFSSQNVKDFILDLRYNKGGQMECVQLLAAILAPQTTKDCPLATLEYNSKQAETKNRMLFFENTTSYSMQNLNLNRLFILTGQNTEAAAEMLINSLTPYMEVILIGEQTKGNYVGTESFVTARYPWKLNLAVCEVKNANKEAIYTDGFSPDISINPLEDPQYILPLGHPQEALLRVALQMIDGSFQNQKKSVQQNVTEFYMIQEFASRRKQSRSTPKGLIISAPKQL